MKVSVTELDLYACPWKWDKQAYSREGLTPLRTHQYLDLGSLVHQTLFTWAENPGEHPADLFEVHANARVHELVDNYKSAVGAGMSQEELAPLGEAIRVGRAMMENYHMRYGQPFPEGWRLISAEQTCVIRVPGTRHECTNIGDRYNLETLTYGCICKRCDHATDTECVNGDCTCCCWHELEGTFDGLLADQRDLVWIMENKTWDKHPNVANLKRTPQFSRYEFIAQQLGMNIGGIAYNGLWSRATVGPRNKFDDLFLRDLFPVNQPLVDKIGQEAAIMLNQMAMNLPLWKKRDFLCPSCGVYELCQAHDNDEDYEYVKATRYRKRPRTIGFAD